MVWLVANFPLSIQDHATKMQNKIIKYGNIQAGYTSDVVYAMLYSNLNLLFVRGT